MNNRCSAQPGTPDSPVSDGPPQSAGRLAIVATSFPPALGGAEVFTYQLSERLAARGWRVNVLTARKDAWRPRGVTVDPVLLVSASKRSGAWFLDKFLCGLRRLGRRRKHFDLILFSMVDPYLAAAGVWHALHGCPPYVLRIAGEANLDLLVRHRLSPLLRWAARRSAGVIVMNEQMAERLIRIGFASAAVHVVPNGVDCTLFHPPEGLGARDRPPVLGCVSRLEYAKGADVLLDVIRRAPSHWRWQIIGRGTLAADMARIAAEKANVDWVESFARDSMPDFYRGLDVFVLPSRDEGMSNALLEAMASGLPCVVSDIPANDPFGDAVLRTPVGDADEVRTALHELTAAPERRRRLGRRARACVEARFSIERVVAAYHEILWQAAARRRLRSPS